MDVAPADCPFGKFVHSTGACDTCDSGASGSGQSKTSHRAGSRLPPKEKTISVLCELCEYRRASSIISSILIVVMIRMVLLAVSIFDWDGFGQAKPSSVNVASSLVRASHRAGRDPTWESSERSLLLGRRGGGLFAVLLASVKMTFLGAGSKEFQTTAVLDCTTSA